MSLLQTHILFAAQVKFSTGIGCHAKHNRKGQEEVHAEDTYCLCLSYHEYDCKSQYTLLPLYTVPVCS